MSISTPLIGTTIDLLSIEEKDAQFTLDIRNDENLTEYIPKVESTLESQITWIKSQREKVGDFFYLIADKTGKPLGTASVYDVDSENGICEYGRFISYGNAYQNVEAAILSLEYAFGVLGMGKVIFNNDERNKKIINFWKRFGAELDGLYDYGTWKAKRYILTKEVYEDKVIKIKRLFLP